MSDLFLVDRDPVEYDGKTTHKTSLVFTLDEGSGQLFKALSVFALRDMNITKIEGKCHESSSIFCFHI